MDLRCGLIRAPALCKGPYVKMFFEKLAVQDLFQLGGISYGEKGLDLKTFFGGTNPENRDIQCITIHFLIGRGPRAPMTRECIPILS